MDAVSSTSLRETKKRATRDALVAAGLALFDRDGYAATSVEAIAAQAGVSRRTFFRYFADKDEVVFADDANLIAVVLCAVDGAPADLSPLAVIRRAGHALAARLTERSEQAVTHQKLVATVPALQARSLVKQRRWEALLAERLAARPQIGERDAALAAKVGVACVQAALDAWLAAPRTDLAQGIDRAFARLAALAQDATDADV